MVDDNAVIGRIIARYAPDGWRTAWIDATLQDGYVGNLTSDYIDGDGRQSWFDIADAGDVMAVSQALLALRNQTRQPGQAAFSACTFTLTPDGAFKLDVRYPDRAKD